MSIQLLYSQLCMYVSGVLFIDKVWFLCGKVLSKEGPSRFMLHEREEGEGEKKSTHERTDATHVSLHQMLVAVLKAF